MKFLNPRYESEELTYEDIFLLQNYFEGESRFLDVNVRPTKHFGTRLPIVSANMNAVTGKRMAETMARIGGL
jgi:IMP dehydrogenase